MGNTGEEQLLEFLYACPVGLIECDLDGEIRMINPHAMQHLLPLVDDRDSGNLYSALERHAPELRHLVSDFVPPTGRICDGHRIAVDLGGRRRTDAPKILACTLVKLGPDRVMATLADISEQVVQEQRLRQADAWFSTLLDQVNDYAVVTLSAMGEVRTANDAFTKQTGHPCEAVLGRHLIDVLGDASVGSKQELDDQLLLATRDGWHLLEGWQQRREGERYWCQRLVVARHDDAHPDAAFTVVLRDVPQRGVASDDLRRLLTCDHLTGVANRMHFSKMLERSQAHWRNTRQPTALVMLDLDHFKRVNDTYGHPTGDAVLRAVAEACAGVLPAGSTFARIGGEEFCALLPRSGLTEALRQAETMREAVAAIGVAGPGGTIRPTASFGCATLEEAGGSVDDLVAITDRRLYAAKRDGRNRVHHPNTAAAW